MKGNKISGNSNLNLKFSENPNSIEVLNWKNEMLSKYEIKEHGIIVPQEEGEYIFEIIGDWDKGKVSYVVKILVE